MYLATLMHNLSAWRQRRRAIQQLAELDDRILRDIGLNRAEITHAVLNGRPY